MKSALFAGLLASILYSQQAVATYSWNNAQKFSSPQNCDNQCTGQQTGGWTFDGIADGSVGNFDGMNFSGFKCQKDFHAKSGKRGLERRTQFSGKALVGKATNDNNCPTFSSSNKEFSISTFQISVDVDAILTFEYIMGNGDVCKQKQSCSTGGTTVKNTQCGGAKQVRVKGNCNFGFHRIDFDCSPPTPPQTPTCKSTETLTGGSCVPKTSSTTVATSSKTTPITTPATTSAATTPVKTTSCETDYFGSCKTKKTSTTVVSSTTSASVPSTTQATTTLTCGKDEVPDKGTCSPKTPTGGSTTATSTCGTSMTNSSGTCVPFTTDVSPNPPCKENETSSGGVCVPKTTPPASTTQPTMTTPPASSDIVTTEIVVTTVTTCPVTITSGTITSITQTISTTTITSTATFCPKCGEVPPTGGTTVDSNQPTPPTCKDTEELKNGNCVPKGPTGGVTSTAPPSSSSVVATTACSEGSTIDKGTCVKTPTGGITSTAPPTSSSVVATTACSEGSTMDKGTCVKTPTGGLTTSQPTSVVTPPPQTTTVPVPGCKDTEELKDGNCVPKTASTSSASTTPAPSCKDSEQLKDGKCVPKTITTSSSSTAVSPPPPNTPVPEAPCPPVLPRCLSTWMQQAGACTSNSDVKCFCPSKDIIDSVQQCVLAWGTEADVQGALSFLAGICADFVPQNPGICTGVPSTVTLVPTLPAGPTGGAQPPAPTAPIPTTVITFTNTVTEGSTIVQTVTVPQVQFDTITQSVTVTGATGSQPTPEVGLIPAVPLTTPTGNAVLPAESSWAPVAGQTSVPVKASSTTATGPIATFTGSAAKTGLGVAAGIFGLIAFLA